MRSTVATHTHTGDDRVSSILKLPMELETAEMDGRALACACVCVFSFLSCSIITDNNVSNVYDVPIVQSHFAAVCVSGSLNFYRKHIYSNIIQ